MTQTFDGEQFLLANIDDFQLPTQGNDRIIIFSSSQGLDLLSQSKTWSGDGTFGIVPSPFYQLYTLLAEIDGKSYPVAFGFLPNKKAFIYKSFFQAIRTALVDTNRKIILERFLLDFEMTAVREFQQVFGKSVRISGCMVHFRQNLRKRLCQTAHLQSWACSNADFHTFLSCLVGLCYVPFDLVPIYYKELLSTELPQMMADLDKDTELDDQFKQELKKSIDDYLNYFEKNYVGFQSRTGWAYPRYPNEIWNQHDSALDLAQRTTNRNESFHSVLRKQISVNSSMWTVIDALKDQEAKVRVRLEERRAAGSIPSGKRECRRSDNDLALKNIVERRTDYSNCVEYLKRVSTLEKFD